MLDRCTLPQNSGLKLLNLLYFNGVESVFMPLVHKINVCKSSFYNLVQNDPYNLTNVGLIQLLI